MSERVAEAGADAITPSDVYQIVDIINGEMALLHVANNATPVIDRTAPEPAPRQPRHVLQKAREVPLKVPLLRRLNGLAESVRPPMPLREVRPADEKGMVELIRRYLTAPRPLFGVTQAPISLEMPSGKTPTDVYSNLLRAGAQLDGLGIPGIVPNDVYRVAPTIISDPEKARPEHGYGNPMPTRKGGANWQPSDVYTKAFDLPRAIESLTSGNSDFEIPGGVAVLNPRSVRTAPAHVMDVLNKILAEIWAIKVKVGARNPTEFAPAQAGKTPTEVHDAVVTVLAIVKTLK